MNATSPATPPTIDWRKGLLLFLAVLALSLPQAALLPLLDRDEPRFAEASREMLQSGNYVVPTFNNAPRYAKPPLIYWCQTVAYRIFGENAFAARLPSLLATAATACLLMTWGTRLGSAQMGLGAGLSYAFCFQTIQQGRVATADALLIFFMTLIAFTGWLILRPKNADCARPICYVIFALAVAGGFLAKGPEAFLPVLPLLWCARQSRPGVIATLIVSFIAGVILVLLWAIPAYLQTNGDYWKVGLSEGVGQRIVTGLQGHGATSIFGYLLGVLFYYPMFFLLGALPFWPLFLIHRKKLFGGWRPDLADTYLILNAALIFLVFSFIVTKLPHYTLPAFPFLALLFTRRWHNAVAQGGPATSGEPALSGRARDEVPRAQEVAQKYPPTSGGILYKSLPIKLAGITGLAFTLLAAIGIPIALASHATPSPVGQLVRQAGDNLKPNTQFALVDFNEPNAIWEMRRVTTGYAQSISDEDVISFLDQSGPRAIILSTELWQRFKQLPNQPHPVWQSYQAHGFNAAKLKSLDLTLVVKP